ncbi:hypothetical protein ES703_109304 [subsurface metagenome]
MRLNFTSHHYVGNKQGSQQESGEKPPGEELAYRLLGDDGIEDGNDAGWNEKPQRRPRLDTPYGYRLVISPLAHHG